MSMHNPGDPLECYGLPIVLHKEPEFNDLGQHTFDEEGKQRYRCGFRIGGGIDQDPMKSPQGYPDNGVYITLVYEGGPAFNAGLQIHDKILQVNGHDMTVVTHRKATEYIKRKPVLNMLVYRKGIPQMQKMDAGKQMMMNQDFQQPVNQEQQQQQQQVIPQEYMNNHQQQQQQHQQQQVFHNTAGY